MALLHTFIDALLRSSLQASVAAILVAAICLLFGRRLSPGARYGLWGIVVLRLLIPAPIPTSWSLLNLIAQDTKQAQNPSPPLPAGQSVRVTYAPATALPPIPAAQSHALQPIDWRIPALLVWAAGAAVLALRIVQVNLRFARRLRRATLITDPAAQALLARCQREAGLHRPIELLATDAVSTPAIAGLRRPRLLLPPHLLASLSPEELRFVFLHELAHVARRDLLVDWVLTFLAAMHWFNPILWIAFARCRVDRELARDAMVMRLAAPEERLGYGRTLLKLAEFLAFGNSSPAALGMMEEKGQLQRRIRAIATGRRAVAGATAIAVLLVLLLGLILLTDRKPNVELADSASTVPATTAPAAPSARDEGLAALPDRKTPEVRFDEAALPQVAVEVKLISVPEGFSHRLAPQPPSMEPVDGVRPPRELAPRLLNDAEVAELLKVFQATPQAQVLTAPRLTCSDGQEAQIAVLNQQAYVADFKRAEGKAAFEPVLKTVDSGVRITVLPTVITDRRSVVMDLRPVVTVLKEIAQVPFAGSPPEMNLEIQKPLVDIREMEARATVGDQQTLILRGFTHRLSTEPQQQAKPTGSLILLVKPRLVPPKQGGERKMSQPPRAETAK